MAIFTLTGTGIQALSTPGSLAVVITVPPTQFALGTANPRNLYHAGMLRLGTPHGYLPPIPLEADAQLLACPNGVTLLGYHLAAGCTITVEERAEVPYAGPTGPPGATGAAGSPGAQLLSTVTVTSAVATLDFSSISAAYVDLELRFTGLRTSNAATKEVQLLINNDSATHYARGDLFSGPTGSQTGGAASEASCRFVATAPATSATVWDCSGVISIPDYLSAHGHVLHVRSVDTASIGFGVPDAQYHGYYWNQAAAINRLTLQLATGALFDQGVARLYGVL